jgi:hypothetical protein
MATMAGLEGTKPRRACTISRTEALRMTLEGSASSAHREGPYRGSPAAWRAEKKVESRYRM